MARVLGAQLQESELQAKLTVREALELYTAFHDEPLDWRPLAERLGLTEKLTPGSASSPAARSSACSSRSRWSATPGRRPGRADHRPGSAGPPRHLGARRGHPRNGVTVLLVTHFMEEAQRLCDRVAMIDAGRRALDTPGLLLGGRRASSFTPSAPSEHTTWTRCPRSASIEDRGAAASPCPAPTRP